MALIHHDASEDLLEKSAGRATLSSVDLVDMVGGGVEGCCGEGWVGGTEGIIRSWLGRMKVLWGRLDVGPTGGTLCDQGEDILLGVEVMLMSLSLLGSGSL